MDLESLRTQHVQLQHSCDLLEEHMKQEKESLLVRFLLGGIGTNINSLHSFFCRNPKLPGANLLRRKFERRWGWSLALEENARTYNIVLTRKRQGLLHQRYVVDYVYCKSLLTFALLKVAQDFKIILSSTQAQNKKLEKEVKRLKGELAQAQESSSRRKESREELGSPISGVNGSNPATPVVTKQVCDCYCCCCSPPPHSTHPSGKRGPNGITRKGAEFAKANRRLPTAWKKDGGDTERNEGYAGCLSIRIQGETRCDRGKWFFSTSERRYFPKIIFYFRYDGQNGVWLKKTNDYKSNCNDTNAILAR